MDPGFWNKTRTGAMAEYICTCRGCERPRGLKLCPVSEPMGGLRGCACGEHNEGQGRVVGGSRSFWRCFMAWFCPSEMLISLWFNTLIPGLVAVCERLRMVGVLSLLVRSCAGLPLFREIVRLLSYTDLFR